VGGVHGEQADLSNCDMTDAMLDYVVLRGANMRGSIAVNANFIRSDMGEIDATDADFTDAIIDKVCTSVCLRGENRGLPEARGREERWSLSGLGFQLTRDSEPLARETAFQSNVTILSGPSRLSSSLVSVTAAAPLGPRGQLWAKERVRKGACTVLPSVSS
jgi:hypothetical protein